MIGRFRFNSQKDMKNVTSYHAAHLRISPTIRTSRLSRVGVKMLFNVLSPLVGLLPISSIRALAGPRCALLTFNVKMRQTE